MEKEKTESRPKNGGGTAIEELPKESEKIKREEIGEKIPIEQDFAGEPEFLEEEPERPNKPLDKPLDEPPLSGQISDHLQDLEKQFDFAVKEKKFGEAENLKKEAKDLKEFLKTKQEIADKIDPKFNKLQSDYLDTFNTSPKEGKKLYKDIEQTLRERTLFEGDAVYKLSAVSEKGKELREKIKNEFLQDGAERMENFYKGLTERIKQDPQSKDMLRLFEKRLKDYEEKGPETLNELFQRKIKIEELKAERMAPEQTEAKKEKQPKSEKTTSLFLDAVLKQLRETMEKVEKAKERIETIREALERKREQAERVFPKQEKRFEIKKEPQKSEGLEGLYIAWQERDANFKGQTERRQQLEAELAENEWFDWPTDGEKWTALLGIGILKYFGRLLFRFIKNRLETGELRKELKAQKELEKFEREEEKRTKKEYLQTFVLSLVKKRVGYDKEIFLFESQSVIRKRIPDEEKKNFLGLMRKIYDKPEQFNPDDIRKRFETDSKQKA